MKTQYILLLLVSVLLFSCNSKDSRSAVKVTHHESGFSIHEDTLYIDVKGDITHAVKLENRYYILFEQRLLRYGGNRKRWMCVFSDGKLEKTFGCPSELRAIYLDFFVKGDSIILKSRRGENVYYFDRMDDAWRKIAKADDFVFEDENFHIDLLRVSDWEVKTRFKDKKTGKQYLVDVYIPLVNKIDTSYYFSDRSLVLRVDNLRELLQGNGGFTIENVLRESEELDALNNVEQAGFEVIYENILFFNPNVPDAYKSEPKIITSFVVENELLHLFTTDTTSFIGKIENKKAIPIIGFDNQFRFFNDFKFYRLKNKSRNETLIFNTANEQLSGLVEIVDKNIYIHYLLNKAELMPKPIGQAKADEVFEKRLDYYLSNFNQLKLKDVEKHELSWDGFDITPNHVIYIDNAWNPQNHPIDINKAFLIEEDSVISNSVLYFGTKSDNLVRSITINWEKTDLQKGFSSSDEALRVSEVFKNKFSVLENLIAKRLGNPLKEDEEEIIKRVWKTSSGLSVKLYFISKDNFNEIRFVMYQN